MATDSVGRVIGGRYRLISRLAQGGMGVTYRAWDLRVGCPVVLKMPRRPTDDADGTKAALLADRFVREIESMRALAHDHIVPIVDSGDDDGLPYVVMRFLPGGSLADHRKKDDAGTFQPMPAGVLHFWLPAISQALDFIHARGVVHRDVKPANIFFDGFWWAFLGDFGIAKVFDTTAGMEKGETLTGTQFAVGTPEYMAPEMLMPKAKLDGFADQYALAVSVYEMVAGIRPFTGEKAHIVVEHATMPPPALDCKRLHLPASAAAAIERGLSKKAAERFESCEAFSRAVLADVTPQPNTPGIVRLLCPECQRILRAPQSAGGRGGTCPTCKTAVEIAADFSALWRAEEAGIVAKNEPVDFEAVPFAPAVPSSSPIPQSTVPSSTSVPLIRESGVVATRRGRSIAPWLAIAGVVVAVTLASAGIAAGLANWRWGRAIAGVNDRREQLTAAKAARSAAEAELPSVRQQKAAASTKRDQLAAEVKKLVELTNSFGMKLRLIPAGTFLMGSATGESNEQPVHEVTISQPFYLGVYEVTTLDWTRVMGDSKGISTRPVGSVSWDDAVSFCAKLSAIPAERAAGRVYRLPTEAEWEYACRAGTTTAYSFGDDEALLGDFAWFYGNSGNQSHPVGFKKPNPWGLYDMHGNVLEWCSDWQGDYGAGSVTDPQGPTSGSHRILRGGGWKGILWSCRSAYRHRFIPSDRNFIYGFRLALSPSGE